MSQQEVDRFKLGLFFREILKKPMRVFSLCLILISVNLLLNGNIYHLWTLQRDQQKLKDQILKVKSQVKDLDKQIRQAKDPSYLERQALDRYDFVEENDLVFIFSDE